jgi:hypothetical protein
VREDPVKIIRCVVALGACLLFCVAAGCGGGTKGVVVKGKVTKGGKPLDIGKNQLQVILRPEGEKMGDPFAATITDPATGAFEVKGRDNATGIPAGKYKITVELFEYTGTGRKDLLDGKYNDKNSTLIKDVDGASELILDL